MMLAQSRELNTGKSGAQSAETDVFINEYRTRRWPWPGCTVLVLLSDGRVLSAEHTGATWKVKGVKDSLEGNNGQPWLPVTLHVLGWKLDPKHPAHPDTVQAYMQGHARHMYQIHTESKDAVAA